MSSLPVLHLRVGKAELLAISEEELKDDDKVNQIQNSTRSSFSNLHEILSRTSSLSRDNLAQKRRKPQPPQSLSHKQSTQG